MRPLVAAIVQCDAGADPRPALSSLAGARAYVVRPPGLDAPAPPGARALVAATPDRAAVAAAVRRLCPEAVIAVLEAEERASPELAAALAALAGGAARGAFRARLRVRLLGREVAAGAAVMAWAGEDDAGGPPGTLAGAVVRVPEDLTTAVARLDAWATWAAGARGRVGVADFTWRPAGALGRRLAARRRDGVPGVVLSVVETFGEVLAAAKAWERARPATVLRGLPESFRSVETPAGWLVLRRGSDPAVEQVLRAATPEEVAGERVPSAGRGAAWTLALGDGSRAVLRWYRRGGLVRHLVRDRFFGWRTRPMLELAVTEEVRRRGVPAAEVLGARVDRLAGGCYRGALVTREVAGTVTLAAFLAAGPGAGERARVLAAVGRTVRAMHDRGVHHRDLNAANILVRVDAGTIGVHVIDFDRAQVRARLPRRLRRRALSRFARSLARLERTGAVAGSAAAGAAVARAYEEQA